MQAQLSESQKLIDQEQQLRMVTERKFQLIEQQQDQEEPDTAEDKKWWQFWKWEKWVYLILPGAYAILALAKKRLYP